MNNLHNPSAFSRAINARWTEAAMAIIEVAKMLVAAKENLGHGAFLPWIERELPFSPQTAQKLMKIARTGHLTNAAHVRYLPPNWGTIYELTKVDEAEFSELIEGGIVRPDMERSEIDVYRKRQIRAGHHAALAQASEQSAQTLGRRLYPIICIDCPWPSEAYSDAGMLKAQENKYPTMSFDEIRALDIPALDESIMFMWGTANLLDQQIGVLKDWGYRYVTNWDWWKDEDREGNHHGQGHWSYGDHEHILIGRKGTRPGPPPVDLRRSSVWGSPRRGHSVKPDELYAYIHSCYPTLPKLDMFARTIRPGWDGWGNQYEGNAGRAA